MTRLFFKYVLVHTRFAEKSKYFTISNLNSNLANLFLNLGGGGGEDGKGRDCEGKKGEVYIYL